MIERTESEIMKNWKGDPSLPLVSICTRTYNLEKFIAEALDSFLMQETDFPFEIVIDDDCSTDGTVEVIREYMKKFPHIINANLRKVNIGVRMNFIHNLQRAKGKYIAPCDGDDYWTDPSNLQKHIDFLSKNDDYVVSYSSLEPIFEKGVTVRTFNWNTKDRSAFEIQKNFLGTGICAVCFRNVDIIKEYPLEYHCAIIDDNFLGSLLGAYGKGKFLKNIQAPKYRQHTSSDYSSKAIRQKSLMYHQTYFALYMYYTRIGNKTLSDYFHKKSLEYSFRAFGRSYYIGLLWESTKGEKINLIKKMIKKSIKKIFYRNKKYS